MKDPEDIIIVGGGEHARVIAETILLQPARWRLVAVVDGRTSELANQHSVRCIGDDADAPRLFPGAQFVLGVGQSRAGTARRDITRRYDEQGARWATLMHPTAFVSASAVLGAGTVVLPGAVVHTGARVGCHVVVNTASVIEHDAVVEDFVSVGPGTVVGGGARISEGAFLGLGCRIRDHVRVGCAATVGMGAAVVSDVPDQACVTGVPAVEKRPRVPS